jgi:Abnormal spindle-like microcephaly-assoc'd, ASPM-SPD-2-Hydin
METTRQCRGTPDRITRLLGAILLAQLLFCVSCGAPIRAGNDSLPAGAPGQLATDRPYLSFGTVTVGNSSWQTLTAVALTASVTISQANVTGDGFSVTGPALPTTLTAGQSASFVVNFTPSTAGGFTGRVSLISNGTDLPTTITVSGIGVDAAQLATNPTSLTFGTVTVGNSSSQMVTVMAVAASVTISQANVTGDGFGLIGPALPTTLTSGRSASFTVNFSPPAAGSFTGTVSLISNAANTPTTIALSGTGVNGSLPHSVALSWDASTSTGVVGYYVDRGTQSGGPYTRLTSSPIEATIYTDTSVAAGTTYYYVVTAVDGNGLESGYSNQASATIPSP